MKQDSTAKSMFQPVSGALVSNHLGVSREVLGGLMTVLTLVEEYLATEPLAGGGTARLNGYELGCLVALARRAGEVAEEDIEELQSRCEKRLDTVEMQH